MATENYEVYGLGGGPGNIIETGVRDIPDSVANARLLRERAANAIASNTTYLALSTPTAAQNTAHLRALTRQVNAIIRLMLNSTDAITDT